jgi:hypothetical protein
VLPIPDQVEVPLDLPPQPKAVILFGQYSPRNFFSSRYHLQDITEQAVTIAKDYEHVARIYGFDDMVQANCTVNLFIVESNTEMVEEAMPSMDNGRSLSVI